MSVKKNFFYNSILLVSQYIIPMIIFPYISRVFGVEKLGLINWVESMVNYFILFSMLGLTVTGVRETARCRNNQSELNAVFSELLLIHIIFTGILLILYFFLILTCSKFSDNQVLFYVGISKIVFNVFLIEWYFRGTENFKFITIRSVFVKFLYVIAIFLFVKNKENYVIYFILTCSVTIINAIINLWYAKKTVSFTLKNINLKRHYSAFFTVGLYVILTSMYTTFNIVFLGLVSTAKAVGYYTTALKLYTIILGLFSALNSVLIPRLSSLIATNDLEVFDRMIEKSLVFVVTLCFPIIVCGIVLAPQIIYLISGSGFEDAIICFRIILPLIAIVGFAQVFANQILMTIKKDKELAYNSIIGAIVGIILNITLVPSFSQIGTTLTVFLSETCITISLYLLCKKYINLRLPLSSIFKNLMASLLYMVICGGVSFSFEKPIVILAISSFLAIIYFVISQKYFIKNGIVIEQMNKMIEIAFTLTSKKYK